MHFDVLQTISVNGQVTKANDDRCWATARLAWVIDGATDLSEPGLLGSLGGASWLASTASVAFSISDASNMRETCQNAFTHIENRFEVDRTREVTASWEVPRAAFAATLLTDRRLSVAWAADCSVLLVLGDHAV